MDIGELQRRLDAEAGLKSAFIAPIAGGAINRSFKVTSGGEAFIVKHLIDEGFTQRNRPKQFKLQTQMARAGLAPEPVFLSKDNLLHIERWAEGQSLEQVDLPCTEKIEQAAILLARLHHTDVSSLQACPKLDLPDDWQNYFRFVGNAPNQVQQRTIEQAKDVLKTHPQMVLCHNDPAYAHMLYRKDTCVLLDWEYSALASRYFDLAAFALINQLKPTQRQLFLQGYARHSRLDINQVNVGFNDFLPVVELTNTLWLMAAEHQQTLSN